MYTKHFKAIEEIFRADSFSDLLVKIYPDSKQEIMTISDWHNEIAAITLNDSVPIDIREQYDIAKNVLLYSWYSYRMRIVAWLYSYSVLENALREKYKSTSGRSPGLYQLLERAIRDGLLNDSGFHETKYKKIILSEQVEDDAILQQVKYVEVPESERKQSTKYIEGLSKAIPSLRNALAHGEHVILEEVLTPMLVNAEIINMLFE
jgi:hypothetical protein